MKYDESISQSTFEGTSDSLGELAPIFDESSYEEQLLCSFQFNERIGAIVTSLFLKHVALEM